MLVYWGRKGGGLDLFEQSVNIARETHREVIVSPRPLQNSLKGISSLFSFLNLPGWLAARKNLIRQAVASNVRTVVFIMASPWDLFLGKKLIDSGIQVIRVIHDGRTHMGDVFPPNFWIKLLTRDCTKIVTLSQFVTNQLINLYDVKPNSITTSNLPFPSLNVEPHVSPSHTKRVLMIGRGKKYKGQSLLESSWELMSDTDAQLNISGRGFKANLKRKDIIYDDSWLSNIEFINQIVESTVVVLPYLQASQSGIIPICTALQIPVVVTPVGGLPEQVIDGETGIILRDLSSETLARGIKRALTTEWDIQKVDAKKSQLKFLNDCLTKEL